MQCGDTLLMPPPPAVREHCRRVQLEASIKPKQFSLYDMLVLVCAVSVHPPQMACAYTLHTAAAALGSAVH